MRKKVVVFGGGTGIGNLLNGLKNFPVDITAVIAVSDNGASTGKLREEFLMPAMGDLRNVIVSLSDADEKIKDLLQYRFDTYTALDGHPMGNLIMVGMYNLTGSLKESINVLSDFLSVKHKILPLSEDYLTLMAETEDGDIIRGEVAVGTEDKKIKKVFYDEEPTIDNEIIKEIKEADLIIFSIGSLYTSIIPHLIAKDVVNAIDDSKAKLLYTCNAVGQIHETEDYTVSDHVKTINNYLGKRKIDTVVVANDDIDKDTLDRYSEESKKLVVIDMDELDKLGCKVIEDDLLEITEEGYIRHDNLKLANAIFNYIMRWK